MRDNKSGVVAEPDSGLTPEELKVFLDELDEQINILEEDICRLDIHGENTERIQEIFRAVHTIKGSSALAGFNTLSELTHSLENLLDKLRNREISLNSDIMNVLRFCLNTLKSLKGSIFCSGGTEPDISSIIEKIKEAAGCREDSDAGEEQTDIDSNEIKDLLLQCVPDEKNVYDINISISNDSDWPALRFLQCMNELNQIGEIITSNPGADDIRDDSSDLELNAVLSSPENREEILRTISTIEGVETVQVIPYRMEPPQDSDCKPNMNRCSRSTRVDADVLDYLLEKCRDMKTEQGSLQKAASSLKERYADDPLIIELAESGCRIDCMVDEMREAVHRIRTVPVRSIFSRFSRMVEALAESQGKRIDLVIKGEDLEIDRTMADPVRDILTQLLRNAVGHGAESPKVRKKAGKPERASIHLVCCREQERVLFTVRDDGKGIVPGEIIDAAIDKGLLSRREAGNLDESDIIDLIFQPEVSTVKKATRVSGRGVGMDIVKTNVEKLGGSVSVESKVGQGSTFTIRIPSV